MATTKAESVLRSTQDRPEHKEQHPITVYKIVSVIDGRLESLAMKPCTAIYTSGETIYPPIAGSPLFAYRTLEVALQEHDRLLRVNADNPIHFTAPPTEIWKAETTEELPGPSRIPCLGFTVYPGLLNKCGYGATLADGYVYFWQHTSYCLKHLIGKRVGQKLDKSITICCKDLTLLEQIQLR